MKIGFIMLTLTMFMAALGLGVGGIDAKFGSKIIEIALNMMVATVIYAAVYTMIDIWRN